MLKLIIQFQLTDCGMEEEDGKCPKDKGCCGSLCCEKKFYDQYSQLPCMNNQGCEVRSYFISILLINVSIYIYIYIYRPLMYDHTQNSNKFTIFCRILDLENFVVPKEREMIRFVAIPTLIHLHQLHPQSPIMGEALLQSKLLHLHLH